MLWVSGAQGNLGATPLVLTLPIGGEESFMGVVDLVAMKGITWQGEVRDPLPTGLPWHACAALLRALHACRWSVNCLPQRLAMPSAGAQGCDSSCAAAGAGADL